MYKLVKSKLKDDEESILAMSILKQVFNYPETPEELLINEKKKNKTWFFLYEKDDMIGITAMTKKNGYAIIGDVGIKHGFQGKGIGTIMMQMIMKKEHKIELFAIKEITKRFYMKLGFRVVDFTPKDEIKDEISPEEEKEIEGFWVLRWEKKSKAESFLEF